jgi:hypothetical protein
VVFTIGPGNKTREHAVKNTDFTSAEKARTSRSEFKTMLMCFFDHKGTWTKRESTVLFGSADKVTGICSEEEIRTLA